MNKELAKTLTTALVQWIDKERPEGTMCCSNTDCENIRAAFEEGEYDVVETFIQNKLSRLTEFEKTLAAFVNTVLAKEPHNPSIWIIGSGWADKLLALAKEQLLSYADESNPKIEAMADLERTFECNPDNLPLWLKNELGRIRLEAETKGYKKGYKKGYEVAEKVHNAPSFITYQPLPLYQSRPLCWEPGGTCTNPHMDCINCPRNTTGGFNTSSGTSTAKAEE